MWYSGCIWPTRYTTTATIRPLNSSRQPVYLSVYPKHIYKCVTVTNKPTVRRPILRETMNPRTEHSNPKHNITQYTNWGYNEMHLHLLHTSQCPNENRTGNSNAAWQ